MRDLKVDSEKLEVERKEKAEKFKQQQSQKQGNNKRKLDAPTQGIVAEHAIVFAV